ncbi:5129_t:CDS:2, partial [Gigaspora margarita]
RIDESTNSHSKSLDETPYHCLVSVESSYAENIAKGIENVMLETNVNKFVSIALVLNVNTRWTSTFECLDHVLRTQATIYAILAEDDIELDENIKHPILSKLHAKSYRFLLLSERNWSANGFIHSTLRNRMLIQKADRKICITSVNSDNQELYANIDNKNEEFNENFIDFSNWHLNIFDNRD